MAYHWKNGVYFAREKNGDVIVYEKTESENTPRLIYKIPAAEWVSIIVAVSKEGIESSQKYSVGRLFHGI